MVHSQGENERKENVISGIQLYNKKYHQKLNHFKKPRKVTNDFFNHYIFVRTFQWTSSECLTNVAITVKVILDVWRSLNTLLMSNLDNHFHLFYM